MSESDRQMTSKTSTLPRRKTALGPPHDTHAILTLTLAFAAALFFTGRFHGEGDTVGWVGMLVSLAVAVAAVFYIQRAYGSASRGWGTVPVGARVATIFGFMYVQQFVPAALYEQYFHESLLAYSLSCLAVAALPLAVLRAAMGKAPSPKRIDETKPGDGPVDGARDAETRLNPGESSGGDWR